MGRPKAAARGKKAEKAKVKLKGHATKFLPKGMNITKTAFKVRRIVLQDQLKIADNSQPLTTRKLNIKEVLSKFHHYSSPQRQEGLAGLSELISQMDRSQLTSHLSGIVDGLGRLSLDSESSVRKHSAHILSSLFSLVKESQLMPFSTILGSYLSCAMTHIQMGVQEDSLLLLDAMLESAPAIAAASASRFLPCVLDMISRSRSDHGSSRELSVHLTSNLISSTWRAKVFGRLQALLVVSLKHRRETGMTEVSVVNSAHQKSIPITVDPKQQIRLPLYNSLYATPVFLPRVFKKSATSSKQLLNDDVQLKLFVESLMPLMLNSWMEVNPQTSQKSGQKSEDHGLPLQSALILHCILEIIDLLWQHLVFWEKENARSDLTQWFKMTYMKDINKYLGKGFPYSARITLSIDDVAESQGRGRRKNKTANKTVEEMSMLKLALPFLLKDKDEHSSAEAIPKCVLQNLTLCHLLANVSHVPTAELKDRIFDTLITYLNQWSGNLLPWSDHLLRALQSVFERSCRWNYSLNPLLSAVVIRYQRSAAKQSASHQLLSSQLCELLGEVAVHPKYQHVESCESFQSWISELPASLGSGNVTFNKLCIFNKLASMNNIAFIEGLHKSFESLLYSVKNFDPSEEESRIEKEAALASLFFWIREWNESKVLSLKTLLADSNCSSSLSRKICNILSIQKEKYHILKTIS